MCTSGVSTPCMDISPSHWAPPPVRPRPRLTPPDLGFLPCDPPSRGPHSPSASPSPLGSISGPRARFAAIQGLVHAWASARVGWCQWAAAPPPSAVVTPCDEHACNALPAAAARRISKCRSVPSRLDLGPTTSVCGHLRSGACVGERPRRMVPVGGGSAAVRGRDALR